MVGDNGWDEHKKLIMYRLERNEEEHKQLFTKLEAIHNDVQEIRSSRKILVASISAGVSGVVAILGYAVKLVMGGN